MSFLELLLLLFLFFELELDQGPLEGAGILVEVNDGLSVKRRCVVDVQLLNRFNLLKLLLELLLLLLLLANCFFDHLHVQLIRSQVVHVREFLLVALRDFGGVFWRKPDVGVEGRYLSCRFLSLLLDVVCFSTLSPFPIEHDVLVPGLNNIKLYVSINSLPSQGTGAAFLSA